MNVWEPRLGSKAALSYWSWVRWLIWSRMAVIGFALLFVFGALIHSNFVEVLSYVLFIALVLVGFVIMRPPAKRRFMALASSTLGVNVTPQNFPPKWDDRYAEWCAKNGLAPGRVVTAG